MRETIITHGEFLNNKDAEKLTEAIKTTKVGIWEWDLLQNNLIWDDTMYELYGINCNTFSGAYDAWENGLHPDDKDRGNQEIELALKNVKPFDTEFRVL